VGLEQWPGEKKKLEEEAISKILVADSDSESGAKARIVEDYFEEEEKEQEQKQQQQASAEDATTNTGQ